jgi:hypothetical protein
VLRAACGTNARFAPLCIVDQLVFVEAIFAIALNYAVVFGEA